MKLPLVAVFALLVSGCATIGNPEIASEETISKIKRGTSTKADVKSLVGEPSKVNFTDTGEEVWDHYYMRSTARPGVFIPIVQIFAGGSDFDQRTLTIRFNKEGIVKEVGTGKMKGGAGTVLD